MRATLTTKSRDPRSVAEALSVDNMSGKTVLAGNRIKTTLNSEKVTTLLSTLDDILYCQMVAESLIENG